MAYLGSERYGARRLLRQGGFFNLFLFWATKNQFFGKGIYMEEVIYDSVSVNKKYLTDTLYVNKKYLTDSGVPIEKSQDCA